MERRRLGGYPAETEGSHPYTRKASPEGRHLTTSVPMTVLSVPACTGIRATGSCASSCVGKCCWTRPPVSEATGGQQMLKHVSRSMALVLKNLFRTPKKQGDMTATSPWCLLGLSRWGKCERQSVWFGGCCVGVVCVAFVCARGLVVVGCCGLWWLSSFGCASACSCVVVRCGWRLSACRRYEFHRHSFHHRQLLSHSLRTTFEVFAF